MTALLSSLRMSLRGRFKLSPCKTLKTPIKVLPATELVEEERAPHYNLKHFYPARLYEVLDNRYQITAKLGWGTSSTVWLARDLQQWRWRPTRYVAVKIKANNYATTEDAEWDLRLIEHISHTNPRHVGCSFISTLLDSFMLPGPYGTHVCMVFDPLCEPLWMFKQRFHGNVLPLDVMKPVARMILEGLCYLHSQCHIIHTDLKSDNILMSLREPSVLDKVAQDEMNDPLPQKHLEDRTIYLSRNQFGLEVRGLGRPVITDFGLAVDGSRIHHHLIQPDEYRAPEVIIGAGWSYSVDIWNLGVLILDLVHGRGPFDMPQSDTSPFSPEQHLARIISILGPPPVDMLRQARDGSRYFNAEGMSIMIDNLGFTLTPGSMVSFQDATFPMILMSFLHLCWYHRLSMLTLPGDLDHV
ncbi:protein kinase domain protein [Aspergillus clavatus NRRL 1]|uniref:non-specific serine/threonine protein kinase n=1 Tax=Aspergillus clavatus (strain ATCC 1007 / CBS 513.65 / DSM 816 / NCTC 3887 / NRRL 1 / QM 1276 / 107) TaxID=344612 RepID=A1C5L1_ASPCL|nr:protein kinase domain protein [Aspergillus clavatus NRRL 1]EAW14979.1 protein kinase domain protein [Aspergillus clavatus NRRL 1]